jgi:hypothetical protein
LLNLKILAGKRLSDTDEIFFDILSIYHYILKPREIGNGKEFDSVGFFWVGRVWANKLYFYFGLDFQLLKAEYQ